MMDFIRDLVELSKQRKELDVVPKLFNYHFAEKGWIAFETMNFSVVKSAVELGNQGLFYEANELLKDYYQDVSNIQVIIKKCDNIPAYKVRKSLVLLALNEYKEKRYYSCAYLLLSVVDGFVNDIAGTGFFAEDTDVTAWNSLAGADNGLKVLQKLFSKSRQKTNTKEINIPYRNGIMHGRDLNFNNIEVAARCWGLLAAVLCWGKAVTSDEYKSPPSPEKPLTLPQLLLEIKESVDALQASKYIHERIAEWKPRQIDSSFINIENITSTQLPMFSPERTIVEFFELWKQRNYGFMREYFNFKSENPNERIRHIKRYFGHIVLEKWTIAAIEDKAACITEIFTELYINRNGNQVIKPIQFRLFYNGKDVINGDDGGKWEIIRYAQGDNRYESLERL